MSAKNFKNFSQWKKIRLQVSKSGVFWRKKNQNPHGQQALLLKPRVKQSAPISRKSRSEALFFETTSKAKCPDKPTKRRSEMVKRCSANLLKTWFIIRLKYKFLLHLAVLREKFSIGKYSNFNFQKWGYARNQVEIENLPHLAVLGKTFSIGNIFNFNFQNCGYFGSNSVQIIGAISNFTSRRRRGYRMGNRRF